MSFWHDAQCSPCKGVTLRLLSRLPPARGHGVPRRGHNTCVPRAKGGICFPIKRERQRVQPRRGPPTTAWSRGVLGSSLSILTGPPCRRWSLDAVNPTRPLLTAQRSRARHCSGSGGTGGSDLHDCHRTRGGPAAVRRGHTIRTRGRRSLGLCGRVLASRSLVVGTRTAVKRVWKPASVD